MGLGVVDDVRAWALVMFSFLLALFLWFSSTASSSSSASVCSATLFCLDGARGCLHDTIDATGEDMDVYMAREVLGTERKRTSETFETAMGNGKWETID